jgi:glycosyltransferase involved in cell wall biosynthesis
MNILMFSTYFFPHYSVAAKKGLALAKCLRARGHNIEFVTILRGDESFEGEHDGFKVWRLAMGRGKHKEFGFWWNFYKFMRTRKNTIDILHSHGAYYLNSTVGPLGRIFGTRSLVKTSMAKNDLAGLGQRLSGKLHLFFLKQVDAYIAISKELQDEFAELDLPKEKVFFLPNGVDTERFRPADPGQRMAARSLLGLAAQQPLALTVGVFDERKNIGWLIREWVNNEGFRTGAVLLAVGPQSREDKDGVFLQGLKEIAEGHPDLVRIVGHTDHIETYFQAADFFVLPSTNEGMPNVVLEAMSSGLPCVTTNVSGCGDLIQEGRNGLMFQPHDPEGLGEALKKLAQNNGNRLGVNARHFVETNFSLNSLTDRYEALYSQLTSKSRG